MFQMLIIDDDKELCQLLEDYFRPEHIACRFAHDGQSGLAAILEENRTWSFSTSCCRKRTALKCSAPSAGTPGSRGFP